MKQQNLFILLELPFDPPTDDIAQIKAAIHAKSNEWSRLYSVPQHKSIALEYLQRIPEIEETMLDAEKRTLEAEAAKLVRSSMAKPFEAELRVLEAKGYVFPHEIKELYDKYRPYGFDYPLVKRLVRVPITDLAIKEAAPIVQSRALDYNKTHIIAEHLHIVRTQNLYTFLNLDKNAQTSSLYEAAGVIRNHIFNSSENTSETNARLVLSDICIEIFENEQARIEYDTYLNVSTYPELSDLIHKENERSGYVSTDVLMRLVNFGITTYGTDVISLEEYIRNYCKAYDININIASPHITCHVCKHISPRGTTLCSECSSPLEGNCPVCNTFFTDGAKICTNCGFSVGKMGLAIPFIEKARQNLLENDWVAATDNIHNIERYWPNHSDLSSFKTSLAGVRQSYENAIREIENNVLENRFYTAQKLVVEAEKNKFLVPSKIAEHINKTIESFEFLLQDYANNRSPDYNKLVELSAKVVDSLELNQLLAGSSPESPDKIACEISERGDSVVVEWSHSSSPGLVTYLLVRKAGSVPLTAFDGDILYSGQNLTFEDNTLSPLTNYFYSVFSKRANTYSSIGAVNVLPIMIVPTIERFLAIPADGAAQLTWLTNPNIHQVKLWRSSKLDKDFKEDAGELLNNTRIDSFTDTTLENNITYRYYAVGIYKTIDGIVVESTPVSVEVTPNITPIPVDQFFILPTEETDRYFINWEGPGKEDIIFFASEKMPRHNFGQIVPVEILFGDYEQILIDTHLEKNGRFTLPFVGERFIFPVVVSGKLATVGRVEKLTNLTEVENVSHEILGEELIITLNWPHNSARILTIVWRDDFFPKTVDQIGNQIFTITREEFEKTNTIRISKLTNKNYYFKIFNTMPTETGKMLYSSGVNLSVNNIPAREFFYTIDYKTKLFSSIANISITITSPHIFRLPKAYIIGKEGSIPLSVHDGSILFEIDRERDVAGSIVYKYKSEKLVKNLYVRLFFETDKYYSELRPIPTKLTINN